MLRFIKFKYQQGGLPRTEWIVGTLFLLALIPTLRNVTEENDINIFYLAASALSHGKSMYDGPHLYGMWYYYSPLFASLLVPFTYLPMQVLKLVFIAAGVWMVRRLYLIFKQQLNIENTVFSQYYLITIAVAGLYPIYMNLLYGQLTLFIVWSTIEAAIWVQNKKPIRGGLLLSLGINFKLLPIFFFYYYLIKRNFKFIIYLGMSVIALIVLPYLFIQPDFHTYLIKAWLGLINPLNPEHVTTVGEGGFIDFASIVTKYFTHHEVKTEAQLNIATLSHHEVLAIQSAYRLIILIVSGVFVLKINNRTKDPGAKLMGDIAFFLLCIVSAFPHQRDYSVFMAMPAVALMAYQYFILKFRPNKTVFVFTIICLLLMGFGLFPRFLGKIASFQIHEKRIPGMAAMAFIPVFIYWVRKSSPKSVSGKNEDMPDSKAKILA